MNILYIIQKLLFCFSYKFIFLFIFFTHSFRNLDIRDAVISLVRAHSMLDNKLERHEQRERTLGETIKKGMLVLQKGQRLFEPMKGTFDRLDERVSQIETMLIAQEEKVSDQQNKLTAALESVLKWITDNSKQQNEKPDSDESDDKSDDLNEKFDKLFDEIKDLKKDIKEIKSSKDSSEEVSEKLIEKTEVLINSKIASADDVITKLEEKLSHFYITGPVATTAASPIVVNNEEWQNSVDEMLTGIKNSLDLVKGSSAELIPDREFFHTLNNDTLDAIEMMKIEVLTASDKSFAKTAGRIKETNENLDNTINEVLKTVADAATTSETYYEESKKDFSVMMKDVEALNKIDSMLLKTADNVLDTKRRVEFGVHQIILEVSEVLKLNTKEINSNVSKRFDSIEEIILENHVGSLTNLSSKIETEMSQVWRQIGIMYQEISSSKQSLDRLQEQTELYINGTLSTMDGMEGKVSQITGRMAEVDSNLNYLLGRLSLVTQEFNQIKTGLGAALDNIRTSFMTVQNKISGKSF